MPQGLKVLRARICQARSNWKQRRANRLKRRADALTKKAERLMAEVRAEWRRPGMDRRRVGR